MKICLLALFATFSLASCEKKESSPQESSPTSAASVPAESPAEKNAAVRSPDKAETAQPEKLALETAAKKATPKKAPAEPASLEPGLLPLVPAKVDFLVTVRGLDKSAADLMTWIEKENVPDELAEMGENLGLFETKDAGPSEKPALSKEEKKKRKLARNLLQALSRESFFCLLDGTEAKGELLSQTWQQYRLMSARTYPLMLMNLVRGDWSQFGQSGFKNLFSEEMLEKYRRELGRDDVWEMPNMLMAADFASPDQAAEMRDYFLQETGKIGGAEKVEFKRGGIVFTGFRKSGTWTMKDLGKSAEKATEKMGIGKKVEPTPMPVPPGARDAKEAMPEIEMAEPRLPEAGKKQPAAKDAEDAEKVRPRAKMDPAVELAIEEHKANRAKAEADFQRELNEAEAERKANATATADELKAKADQLDAEADKMQAQADLMREQAGLGPREEALDENLPHDQNADEMNKPKEADDNIPPEFEEKLQREREYQVVVALGQKDGKLVFFVGHDPSGLRLGSPDKNFLSRGDVAWWQQFAGRRVLSMNYSSKAFLESLRGLVEPAPVWAEVKKVYQEGKDGLVNQLLFSRVLDDLVALEDEAEEADISASQGIVFLDEGVRMEGRGGVILPDLDYKRPWTMQGAETLNPFFHAHWCDGEKARARRLRRTGLVFSLLDGVIAEYLAQMTDKDEADLLKKMRHFLQTRLKPELKEFATGWNEISGEGLEGENLLLLDLHGGMPRFPLVPELYTEKGLMPRLLLAKPVREREKLAAGWRRWRGALERTTADVAALADQSMSLPGIISARNGDLWSHFVSFPGTTPDFLPCVSVNDRLFMMGSSKKYAENLADVLAEGKPGKDGRGLLVEVDMAQTLTFARHWADLVVRQSDLEKKEVEKLQDELSGEDSENEKPAPDADAQFDGQLDLGGNDDVDAELEIELKTDSGTSTMKQAEMAARVKRFLDSAAVLERLGKWRTREWVEDGVLHNSTHLEIKGVK